MKKLIVILILFTLFVCSACDKKGPQDDVLPGDAFIGITVYAKDGKEASFIAKVNDKETINYYGTDFNDGKQAGYYDGMDVRYCFECFWKNVRDITEVDESKLSFIVDEEKYKDFENIAKDVVANIAPKATYEIKKDSMNNLEKKIREYKNIMANFGPLENPDNDPGNNNKNDEPGYIIDGQGVIQIDLGELKNNITVEAEGKAVKIYGDDYGQYSVEIHDAGSVDIILTEKKNMDYEKMVSPFISIRNTSYKNISFPSWFEERQMTDKYPTDDYIFYDISDDGKYATVNINHLSVEGLEELKNRDLDFIYTVLEEGLYESDTGGSYGVIYSDIEEDLGEVVLPNSDYSPFTFGGNAKVKISGTLTVTGGKLEFEVRDNATLDISELYLEKAHPSPDIARVSVPDDYKGDRELLKPKVVNGEIKYAENGNRIDITIW